MDCPKCGSTSTQSLVTIHAAGTTVVTTQSTQSGVAIVQGNFVPVVGGSDTTGTHQSLLAQRHAPPAPRETISVAKHLVFGVIAIPLVSVIATVVLGFILAAMFNDRSVSNTTMQVVGAVILAASASVLLVGFVRKFRQLKIDREWNATVYPTLVRDWERTWLCHRCGATYQPDRPSDHREPVAASSARDGLHESAR